MVCCVRILKIILTQIFVPMIHRDGYSVAVSGFCKCSSTCYTPKLVCQCCSAFKTCLIEDVQHKVVHCANPASLKQSPSSILHPQLSIPPLTNTNTTHSCPQCLPHSIPFLLNHPALTILPLQALTLTHLLITMRLLTSGISTILNH